MTTKNTNQGQTPAEADSQGHCALGDGSALLRAYLTELIDDVQEQIDDLKPKLSTENCKDAYEHGWRNGAFFVWVELRRNLKEQIRLMPNTERQQ